jgi:hypothetical protein
MPDEFSHELKQFVEHNIESVPQLEALLLLRKERGRGWKPVDIAKSLYIQEDAASALLADFARRGFVNQATSDAGAVVYRRLSEPARRRDFVDLFQTA